MASNNFTTQVIELTLKNFRQIISSIPKTKGSALVVSPSRIWRQVERWTKLLPTVYPYYAVKCNPDPILLQTLRYYKVGFDCASLREVHSILSLNTGESKLDKIIYAHPMKSENDIDVVDSLGIRMTVVDSVEEYDKLKSCGWKGSTLLRVAVNDTDSKMPFSVKFGCSLEEAKVIAKRSQIPITGVSFHVGSGCENPSQYKQAIHYSVLEVFDILRKNKHNPDILNIGGGYSSKYSEFSKAASIIQEAIKLYINPKTTVIAEPGRYMAQPSQDLFVKIIAKKPGIAGKGWRYVIDESVYGQFSCIPFDHQKPSWIHIPMNRKSMSTSTLEDSVIFGRTCDSLDIIAKGRMDPMEVGDWLYFPLMGAYTSATASEFNGFPKPAQLIDANNLLPDVDSVLKMIDALGYTSKINYLKPLSGI
uniref:Ornithine decarboxylase n=1 Tax=viral metagenome TaxID=1070528 RepID=A0A6C0K890_9ZZZZ